MFRGRDSVDGARTRALLRRRHHSIRLALPAPRELTDPDPGRPPWPAHTVVVDGCGLRVRHTPGAPGAQPALFVHGLGGDSTNFTDLAGVLAPWLDGVAVDLPGFGGSDPARGGDYSPAAQARTVTRLIEEQRRGPVHLFGNSFGGVVCLLLAAARPDLVRTLTLISPAMPMLRPRSAPAGQLRLLLLPGAGWLVTRRQARLSPERRVRLVAAACFAGNPTLPTDRLAAAVAEVRRRDNLPWAVPVLVRSVRALAAAYLAPGRRSLWYQAGRVTAPTLVVWGAQDRLVDVALAGRTAAAIPGARLLLLEHAGHAGQMENPTTVAGAFLALLDELTATETVDQV